MQTDKEKSQRERRGCENEKLLGESKTEGWRRGSGVNDEGRAGERTDG